MERKYKVGDEVYFKGYTVESKAIVKGIITEGHPVYGGVWHYDILLWKDYERFAQTEDKTLYWPVKEEELTPL